MRGRWTLLLYFLLCPNSKGSPGPPSLLPHAWTAPLPLAVPVSPPSGRGQQPSHMIFICGLRPMACYPASQQCQLPM